MLIKCYRIWFSDGGAILVTGISPEDAARQAEGMYEPSDWGNSPYITEIECLTDISEEDGSGIGN